MTGRARLPGGSPDGNPVVTDLDLVDWVDRHVAQTRARPASGPGSPIETCFDGNPARLGPGGEQLTEPAAKSRRRANKTANEGPGNSVTPDPSRRCDRALKELFEAADDEGKSKFLTRLGVPVNIGFERAFAP